MTILFDDASSQGYYTTTLPVSSHPLSYGCWFNADDFTNDSSLGSIGDVGSTNYVWNFGINAGGYLSADYRDTTWKYSVHGSAANTGTWYYALFVYASTSSRICYINSTSSTEDTTAATESAVQDRFAIAYLQRSTQTNFFSGRIAYPTLWNAGLTQAHATFLAAGGHPFKVLPSNIVYFAPEFTTGNLTDVIGGAALTAVGSPTTSSTSPPMNIRKRNRLIFLPTSWQYAYPTTDTTRDNWEDEAGGTTNIYTHIDETTASDSDYIRTQTSPTSDVYVTKLTGLTDPAVSRDHYVKWRYNKVTGTQTIDLTVQLRQGYTDEGSPGTLIATVASLSGISDTWTAGSYALTSTEIDNITDYSSLYLRFVGNAP